MSKNLTLNRRKFLAAIGAGAALLPMLEIERADACLATGPRRLLIVSWANGYPDWDYIEGGVTNFTLPGWMSTKEPDAGVSIADLRGDLLFLEGIALQNSRDSDKGGSHEARVGLLNGPRFANNRDSAEAAGGPSIDQYIASRLSAEGADTARKVLNLGAYASHGKYTIWRGASDPVPPDNDPWGLFDQLFAGAQVQAPAAGADMGRRKAMRKTVIDLTYKQIDRFKLRLGTTDKQTIDAYLSSIHDLEKELQVIKPVANCNPPDLGARPNLEVDNFQDFSNSDNYPRVVRAQMDIALAAFAADVTRVVTIELANSISNHIVPTWLGLKPAGDRGGGVGDHNNHHSISHRGGDDQLKLSEWYHQQFAYLIQKAKSVTEGDASMLDNSAILITNDARNGGAHSTDNIPWMLAGKCGGYFASPGRHLTRDVSQRRVLCELALAMGIDPSQLGGDEYGSDYTELRG